MDLDSSLDLDLGLAKLSLSNEDLSSKLWSLTISSSNFEVVTEQEPTYNNVCITSTQGNQDCLRTSTQPTKELREYQKELAENALSGKNTIICAPTGSGKTRVAIHILLEHLQRDKACEKKKVAFLARTVPLAFQQYKVICNDLPEDYKVHWKCRRSKKGLQLHMLVPEYDVIVMTPMILYNAIKRNELTEHLGVFSLIVFDECHHTHKEEPYNLLMNSYHEIKSKPNIKLPQIVGLTASISVDKAVQVEEAKKKILELCGNMDTVDISVVEKHKTELESYLPVLNETTKQLKERFQDKFVIKINEIMKKLEDNLTHHVSQLKNEELKQLVKKIPITKRNLLEYGQWAEKIQKEARTEWLDTATDLSVRIIIIITKHLMAYNVAQESHDLVELKDVMGYLKKYFETFKADEESTTHECTFYSYFQELEKLAITGGLEENRNLTILANTLKEHLKEKSQRGIIFVKTRALAESLASWLNRSEQSLAALNAAPFTSIILKTVCLLLSGMSQTQQDTTLQQFRTGEVRVLVATSVAEEGLDIPECNLVIKYNHVGNEISTVQTRGRSRSAGGVSVLLALNKILTKELMNHKRVELMYKAIEAICQMDEAEKRHFIKKHQETVLKELQNKERREEIERKKLQHVSFTMVCHLCRKVKIESSKIRLINGTCRVALDSTLLQQTVCEPYTKGAQEHNEIEYVGDVRCKGEPQTGKRCKGFLGSMVRRYNNPFFALGVKNFEFIINGSAKPQTYKQWKNVPYFVQDITDEDTQSYMSGDTATSSNDEDMAETVDDISSDRIGRGEHKGMPGASNNGSKTTSYKRDHAIENNGETKKPKFDVDIANCDDAISEIDKLLEQP
ncbi:unnamed protein product [Lymnaea stagnalis]|uniref:RNA helicase n=1 Tax=Lymnaea stagnalis TaxID=6523 RepID=A0AAV2GYU8_LYMST